MVAAGVLMLIASLQVPRALRARFGMPPAPAPSYYRPGVPYEAFSYTKQRSAVEPQMDTPDKTPKPTGQKETPSRMVHSAKIALATLNRPSEAQGSLSNPSTNVLHISQTPSGHK